MKKGIIWAIVAVIVIALVGVGIYFGKQDAGDSGLKLETADDMKTFLDEVYKEVEDQLPSLDTNVIDVSDESQVTSFTGLKSNKDVDALIVSMPLMNAQAYEVAMVKAKDGADIESMKQEMLDNINMRRWVCVSAEKVYITNSGNIIFMAMASEEWAKPVYDSFKEKVENKIGKELEKSEDTDYELPPEMTIDPVSPVLDGTDVVVPPVVDGVDVDVPTEASGDSTSQAPIAIMVQ